jgi:metal-responsive CopG/Arc/MetJ family transcriptional regulator
MKAVRVLLDEKLLRAVDDASKRARVDRSHLLRKAVVHYLAAVRRTALEEQQIAGYRNYPLSKREVNEWQRVQVWEGE